MSLRLWFYDTPLNKYSVTALLGAMESRPGLLDEITVGFFASAEELLAREEELRGADTLALAFSFFSSQLWEMRDMLRALTPLRERANAVFVGGGPHVSGDAERSVTVLGFDYALAGEGEETFPALIEALLRRADPAGMPGLCCRDHAGRLVNGGMAPRVDIESFDPVSPRFRRYGPLEITRGCPYGCAFCQTGELMGRRVRHRSVETIEKVVRRADSLFQLRFFRALTPNALSYGSPDGVSVDLAALESLLTMLRAALGSEGQIYMGYFPSEVRPNNVTPESVALLRRYVDNRDLVIGAQTGSDRLLRAARRGHDTDDVYRAVETLHAGGFTANVDFICGLPGETAEDALASVAMMERLADRGARINVHAFMPLPQTLFEREPYGRVRQEYLDSIRRLTPRGVVYGDWVRQGALARRMHRYFTTGELDG